MPLPKPNPNEKGDKFIDRCLSDPTMNKEYPKSDQRYAVCQSLKERVRKRKNVKAEEVEWEDSFVNDVLI